MNDTALQWLKQPNHHIIPITDPRYPVLLSKIPSPPPLLYVKGEIETLSRPQIAIVGSRNPSFTGLELSTEFAYLLSQAGLVITSGLALGIDAASHVGALRAGGKTIAVLGSGLQQIYPKRNAALAEKITVNGCLVSEFPLDTPPAPHNFPRRNRIISGLSLGTLVIEAALKSGSLITAHFAAEQGREVFAIPSSIRNPAAKGCLALIQNGAKCVISLADILEEIRPLTPSSFSTPRQRADSNEHQTTLASTDSQVLACIDNEVTTIDQICARSKLSAQLVTVALLQLELNGVVKRQFGGFVRHSL
ncbi:MAG: DNA protecting protein DprA [Gammaproteobacteria bacterium RIFCSPHIGHO2_12_FULL_40_19]|nr:MAG: DNA protecting protein DprA [Gammaproteobacteria bacterium RIFCSPHIGHO2_12_FULL_40_19]